MRTEQQHQKNTTKEKVEENIVVTHEGIINGTTATKKGTALINNTMAQTKRSGDQSEKKSPTKAPVKSPIHKEYKKLPPVERGQQGTSYNVVKVYIIWFKSNEFAIFLEKTNSDEPPYLIPITKNLYRDPAFFRNNFHINNIYHKRHPSDPNAYLEVPPGPTSKRTTGSKQTVFLGMLSNEEAPRFDATKRRQLMDTFIFYINHQDTRVQFQYPITAEVGADLTPEDLNNRCPLSDYLTISDTMEVMRKVGGSVVGQMASIGDILDNREMMEDYYGEDVIEKVREQYQAERNHVPGFPAQPRSNIEEPTRYDGFKGVQF